MRWIFVFMLACVASAVCAEEAKLDGAGEQRVKALAHELRCLVCQNQTIADSNADLAIDLRIQIREQIQGGKTDQQIRDYMVARYGDFVLYKPPVQSNTLLLWIAPFFLLVGAVAFLFWQLKKRRTIGNAEALSEIDLKRADALLRHDETKPSS